MPLNKPQRSVHFWAAIVMLVGSLLLLSAGWATRPWFPSAQQTAGH